MYPTLLTALQKLLQRVEERPNDVSQPTATLAPAVPETLQGALDAGCDAVGSRAVASGLSCDAGVCSFSQELNPVNWLATYLHSNNPNNNLMRKVDDLAADLRARRSRLKIESQEAAEKQRVEDWRDFAANMASMRSQERVRKKVPSLLTKATAPVVQRECFYKHNSRSKASRKATTAQIFDAAGRSAQVLTPTLTRTLPRWPRKTHLRSLLDGAPWRLSCRRAATRMTTCRRRKSGTLTTIQMMSSKRSLSI